MTGYVINEKSFEPVHLEPGLYVVSTPIGNLRDITLRALDVLASVDAIACEDTRVTSKLLARYGISRPLLVYHEHRHAQGLQKIQDVLNGGGSVALVTDAGTPVVSDPGQSLVNAIIEAGTRIVPVPGADAVSTALVISGLPAKEWKFIGFLPHKSMARQSKLQALKSESSTLIFYESPSRVSASLQDMADCLGVSRQAAVCRELTKIHETCIRGTLGDLSAGFKNQTVKGEIVILVGPQEADQELDVDRLLSELLETQSVSKAASEAAALSGLPKRELYKRALELADRSND